jgi:cell wall-associated NlpC family hydrolase
MATTYQVNSDVGVNVRDAPNGHKIGGFMNGTIVTATGDGHVTAGGHVWVKVSADSPPLTGWVAADFLEEQAPPPPPADRGGDVRQRIIAAAQRRQGTLYRMPPGGATLDCSMFLLKVFDEAGVPFAPGVRTAEQIREVCTPIADTDVRPGDLLFFQNTYPAGEGVASHCGISLGSGTGQMWDCHAFPGEAGPPGVGLTNVRTDYWQQHWLDARRPPGLG